MKDTKMDKNIPEAYDFKELCADTKPLPDYLPINRVIPSFQSVTERYFVPKFKLNESDPTQDYCLLTHSNKISLVVLPHTHPILAQSKSVDKVDYQISPNTNRLDNKVYGKKKKGGQKLSVGSVLCHIECHDGSQYDIVSGVKGMLVECNEKLSECPALLTSKPWVEGYVAIVMLPLYPKDAITNEFGFISLEEYEIKRPSSLSKTGASHDTV